MSGAVSGAGGLCLRSVRSSKDRPLGNIKKCQVAEVLLTSLPPSGLDSGRPSVGLDRVLGLCIPMEPHSSSAGETRGFQRVTQPNSSVLDETAMVSHAGPAAGRKPVQEQLSLSTTAETFIRGSNIFNFLLGHSQEKPAGKRPFKRSCRGRRSCEERFHFTHL